VDIVSDTQPVGFLSTPLVSFGFSHGTCCNSQHR
jgi:hypothetical protein